MVQFILGYNHFVGAPGDNVITPFDNDGVAALVLDGVGDVIELVAHVLDIHLLTGSMGSMHAHHEHVGTWTEQGVGDLMIVVYNSSTGVCICVSSPDSAVLLSSTLAFWCLSALCFGLQLTTSMFYLLSLIKPVSSISRQMFFSQKALINCAQSAQHQTTERQI